MHITVGQSPGHRLACVRLMHAAVYSLCSHSFIKICTCDLNYYITHTNNAPFHVETFSSGNKYMLLVESLDKAQTI